MNGRSTHRYAAAVLAALLVTSGLTAKIDPERIKYEKRGGGNAVPMANAMRAAHDTAKATAGNVRA